jgi:hypothetical protein
MSTTFKNMSEYFLTEAEVGSDNEEHDHIIKKIRTNRDDQDEEELSLEDLDTNLEDLISEKIEYLPNTNKNKNKHPNTNANHDQKVLRSKFIQDELSQDKEEIKNIILDHNNKRKKIRKWKDVQREDAEDEEGSKISTDINSDGNSLSKRKKIISNLLIPNSQDDISTFGQYNPNKVKIINVSKYKRLLQLESDYTEGDYKNNSHSKNNLTPKNEELNEMLLNYENDVKKKLSEQSSAFKNKFKDRIKENNQIMENVINLNKVESSTNNNINLNLQKNNSNQFSHSNSNNNQAPLKRNIFLSHTLSQTSQNSILGAIKKDKNYSQNMYSQKLDEDDKNVGGENNTNMTGQHNLRNFPMFGNKNDARMDSGKKERIANIFNKSDRNKIVQIRNIKK